VLGEPAVTVLACYLRIALQATLRVRTALEQDGMVRETTG
jgi:hypothetical protein